MKIIENTAKFIEDSNMVILIRFIKLNQYKLYNNGDPGFFDI